MFPLLIPMGVGALAGALSNKNKPLNGALMGGALGAGGGLLGGAMAGGAGAAGAAGGGSGVGFGLGQSLVSGPAGAATMAGGASAPSAGLLGTLGQQAGQFASTAKPFMDAASTGMTAASLLGSGQDQQPAPQMQPLNVAGPQTLAQLAQGAEDPLLARRQQMMAQQRGMWG